MKELITPTRLFILLIFILLLGFVTLPKPNVMVSADLQTETINMKVVEPEDSLVTLQNALISVDGGDARCASNIEILPDVGSEISYSRHLNGELVVGVFGNVSWRSDNSPISSTGFMYATLSADSAECRWDGPVRLPVSGTLETGSVAEGPYDPDNPHLFLIDGQLKIYGRSVNRVFWVIPIGLMKPILPMEPNKLFLAGEFDLPPGSVLGSETARWWGFADVSPEPDTRGLKVSASTNARTLNLQAPAPFLSSDGNYAAPLKPDVISMTFGDRLSNDPNLRWLIAAFSFLFLAVGLLLQLLEKKSPENLP